MRIKKEKKKNEELQKKIYETIAEIYELKMQKQENGREPTNQTN